MRDFRNVQFVKFPYDIAYQEVVAQSLWRFGDVFKFDLLHYIHIESNFIKSKIMNSINL